MALEKAAGEIAALDDYDCIHALVQETARGRWFLEEHAKRHRHAETQSLLVAMRRLERLAASNSDHHAPRRIQMHMAGLMEALALAQADLDQSGQAISPRLRLAVQALERHASALSTMLPTGSAEPQPAERKQPVPQPAPDIPSFPTDSFVFDIADPS